MAEVKNIGVVLASQFRGLGGRHPGQWPIVPRIMCGVAVFVVAILVGWYFWWDGQMDELTAGQEREVKLREEYQTKIGQANNLDELKKQKEQVGQYVSTLESALPSKSEMDKLLEDINHAGIGPGTNLQFELFRPEQVIVKDYYAEQPIDIKVTGTYHAIGGFSSDIANLSRIVTLNNLNLTTGKDGMLTLDTVAKTFRYLDPAELDAQRSAKGGGKKK